MRRRTALLAAGAAMVLVAGGGTALAAVASSGPVDASGVVHGCYTNQALNGSHVIVLQDAGSNCPKGTTAVSWNEQGPAGATGPAGPAGAIGPPGPPGQAGAAGAAGATGANGNTVLNGTGGPASSLGNNGDFYLDTAADVLYGPKAGGTWPTPGTSLVGSAGAAGSTGPAGPVGPAGVTGPAGPIGPAGAASLDALNGTVCNTGSSNAGMLNVSYGSNGSVSITCTPTTLYTLTVSIPSGDGSDAVVSSPAGIDCDPGAAGSVCSAQFGSGYSVTLTAEPDNEPATGNQDVLAGWGGQDSCPGRVNPAGGPEGPGFTPATATCTVTMNSDQNVSATFNGQVEVYLASDDKMTADIHINGVNLPTLGGAGNALATYVVPYGDPMVLATGTEFSPSFDGAACNTTADPGAIITSTSCTFTMYPGADLGGFGDDEEYGVEITDLS